MLVARLTALALIALAGCTSEIADDDPEGDPDGFVDGKADGAGLGAEWKSVGLGVAYQQVNTGKAILIVYGGYSARLTYSAGWATELVDAKLGAEDVGHVYAVQGPADPGYGSREIGNSKLRAHLQTIDDGESPIFVIGHSSGTYVAHELLSQLYNAGDADVLSRIAYANLDGGGSGLTDDIVASLAKITFVYAHDPSLSSGMSQNASSARALGSEFAPIAKTFEVLVSHTGCANGAGWCMHDVLVTHRPHNAYSYDLARDYTDFVNRPVTTEYL